jgi:hypothetical protein
METDISFITTEKAETEIFLEEESKDFYNYLTRLHMVNKLDNMLVLPARNHFFYIAEEMKGFEGVINLKKLNYVKKINSFMSNLRNILEKDRIFCGCFINNKYTRQTTFDNHKRSKFIKSLILILEARMSRFLSESDVRILLTKNNFHIVNMKEIRGVTYFYAKKI